jgi:hypothetical protein
MNTEQVTALGTAPPSLLVSDEISYAELADVLEIGNHAHAIPSLAIFSQFLIRHATQDFGLALQARLIGLEVLNQLGDFRLGLRFRVQHCQDPARRVIQRTAKECLLANASSGLRL